MPFDEKRGVIANDEGRVELRHISSLDKELPSAAFSSRPRDGDRSSLLYTYHHGGKEYLVSLTDMPADLGKRWQFFVVSPVDDFTGAFNRNNQRLLLIGVAAIVLQVIMIAVTVIFPDISTPSAAPTVDTDSIDIEIPILEGGELAPPSFD